MKHILIAATFAIAGLAATAPSASAAGTIERACPRADRAGSPALCNCIQQVADMVLSHNDQRRAAKFFRDPDAAHAVWISQRPADDAFWDRYKEFGAMAEAYCAG